MLCEIEGTERRSRFRQLHFGLIRAPSVEYAAAADRWKLFSVMRPPIPRKMTARQAIRKARMKNPRSRASIWNDYGLGLLVGKGSGVGVLRRNTLGFGHVFGPVDVEERIDWSVRPFGNRHTVAAGPHFDLVQPFFVESVAQFAP